MQLLKPVEGKKEDGEVAKANGEMESVKEAEAANVKSGQNDSKKEDLVNSWLARITQM